MDELPRLGGAGGSPGGSPGGGFDPDHEFWKEITEALDKLRPGLDHVVTKLGHGNGHAPAPHHHPIGGPISPIAGAFGGGGAPGAVHHAWTVHVPLLNPHVLGVVAVAALLMALADADVKTRERARDFAQQLANQRAQQRDFMMYGKWITGQRF